MAAHQKGHREYFLAENAQLAVGRAPKKDTANSTGLITSIEKLRVDLLAKTWKGFCMALVSQQLDARVAGRANPIAYSQAGIGVRYRIAAQKAKPL